MRLINNERRSAPSRFAPVAAGLFAACATLAAAGSAHAVTPKGMASDQFSIAPGQTLNKDLNCGTGYKAVGGGALTQTPYTRVWRSYPDSTNENNWHFSVTNLGSATETVWINATCATGFFSYHVYPGSTGNFANGTYAEGNAGCPSGWTPMGGGWIAPNATFPIVASYIEGTAWRVRAYNGSGGSNQVGVLATCSASPGANASPASQLTTVAAGASAFPTMTCPSGWLASGGFRSTIDTNWTIVTGSLPQSGTSTSWKWNLKNLDSVSHTYERYLRCFAL